MTSAEYKKLSSEQLCMLWLKETGYKSFTHSMVESSGWNWWQTYGIYRLPSTYKRAMQRLMEHGALGKITRKQIKSGGQMWTQYKFQRRALHNSLRKIQGISHT